MTRNSIQVLIVYTSLSLISAMPFLDTENGPDKFQDEEGYEMPMSDLTQARDGPSLDGDDLAMLTSNAILGILSHYKDTHNVRQKDFTESDDESNEMPGYLSYRGKRFGFRFTPFSRHFRSDGPRRLYTNRVFVASRGKRQKFDDLPYYPDLGLPEVKRRRGFTALRGR